jgi:hypothetical protein
LLSIGLAIHSISPKLPEDPHLQEDTHLTTMPNNTDNQANRNMETDSGHLQSLSPADFVAASILMSVRHGGPNSATVHERAATMSQMEAEHALVPLSQSDLNRVDLHEEEQTMSNTAAAQALVALSQSGAIRTAVHGRAVSNVLVWDVRTKRTRLDSTDENIREVNPFREAQVSGLLSELAERLWSISLVHVDPPQIELAAERITSSFYHFPPVIQYDRYSEVPQEVGRFVDMWDAAGYTLDTVLEMLCRNNVIVPREYIVRRLALQNAVDFVPAPQALVANRWTSDDEFMGEGNLDDDSQDDWEDDFELWYEEH